MLKKEDIKYSYNDVAIVPAKISKISSRSQCNPYYINIANSRKKLPIFASPMSSVVDTNNFSIFEKNDITPILPRNIDFETRFHYFTNLKKWVAFSLEETESMFDTKSDHYDLIKYSASSTDPLLLLIDVANGHMQKLISLCSKIKNKFGQKVLIMTGNIANPYTYIEYDNVDIDFVRCSIGTGDGCITSSNTAVHYGIASLIDEIVRWRTLNKMTSGRRKYPQIIADGGIRNYSDAIKALALGADYVMIGSLFATCKESCGDKYVILEDGSEFLLNESERKEWLKSDKTSFSYFDSNQKNLYEDCDVYTDFYGMASAQGQIAMSGKKTKTSEGIAKKKKVTTTIPKWSQNFKDYLCSAMSYTNSTTLTDFKTDTDLILLSANTANSINK